MQSIAVLHRFHHPTVVTGLKDINNVRRISAGKLFSYARMAGIIKTMSLPLHGMTLPACKFSCHSVTLQWVT